MKFNIMGFDQVKLYNEYSNLNCNDVVVLRTIVDLIERMDVKTKVDNKEFTWIRYKLLVEDLPFITNSESTMKKIVQKLIDAELIERIVVNSGGKYTYFRRTKKCIELEYVSEPIIEKKDKQKEFNDNEKIKIDKVEKVLTERISNKTITRVLATNTEVIEKAIELCEEKVIVTNSYFINAIKLAEQTKNNSSNKSNLRFINFEAREYDYDMLEKKLLGWDD